MKIKTEKVTLLYTCECGATAEQPLEEIVENGTAVCPDCDSDMTLDNEVSVDD